jgi:hypothetical protein
LASLGYIVNLSDFFLPGEMRASNTPTLRFLQSPRFSSSGFSGYHLASDENMVNQYNRKE